jgi:ABC-2 type transport system ATP-binding protein
LGVKDSVIPDRREAAHPQSISATMAVTDSGLRAALGPGMTVPITASPMTAAIAVSHLSKIYAGGFQALKDINLEIRRGEIFALLGPNGAGKTTLINIVCGIVKPTAGVVTVEGHDIITDYRAARSLIGLVPQEITTDAFTSPWSTSSFSRGLFGRPPNPAYIEKILKELSLWDKRSQRIITLSGGMKRRVMIAKALSHEPRILFLDEPTAGVDVELRKDMWEMVRRLRAGGMTIILTTHYIEEAELMADRVGVINKGELILVENKTELMRKLGRKQLTLELREPITTVPPALAKHALTLADSGRRLVYTYDTGSGQSGITELIDDLHLAGLRIKDLHTTETSLEDIFVGLVRQGR